MSSQLFRPIGATVALVAGGANVAIVPSTLGCNSVRIVASTTNVYLGAFSVDRAADCKLLPGEVLIVKARAGQTVNILPAIAGAQCNLWATPGAIEGSGYGWGEEQG